VRGHEVERSRSARPSKADLRRTLLATRRARSDADRREDAALLVAALPALLDGVDDPLCLHVAVGAEPGATPEGAAALPEAARALGRRVLLPVTVGDAPLDWAEFDGPGSLGPGPHGLLEPTGARRGPDAVADAGLVLVPALAVDRRGVRLGRGGGHYDRSLPRAGLHTWLVALVADDGLVDELPDEPHDVAVHAVWRPRREIVAVGPRGTA
jgi:5-formyltetrahydrofolate cyclo-ligase